MPAIRALIIDDSSVMRKIVERSLRQAGVNLTQVLEAGNGAEALAVLERSQVDLILCDVYPTIRHLLTSTGPSKSSGATFLKASECFIVQCFSTHVSSCQTA